MSEPPTPQEGRRSPRADALRNRERVLAAAAQRVAAVGLGAQMGEVAQQAGVGLGTVYRHFPTKALLIAELVARGFDQMTAAVLAASRAETSSWDALVRALRDNLAMLERDPAVRDAMASSRRQDEIAFRLARQRHQVALDELVVRAQNEGSLRRDVGVLDFAAMLCGLSAAMDSHSSLGWERHLAVLLDALRTPPAHAALPPPRPRVATT